MPMNDEVRKAVERIDDSETVTATPHPDCNALVKIIDVDDWWAIRAELTRLTEIAESVDPPVVRLGEVTARLEAHTKMLADCFRMAGADPDGNEDWRIATDALRAVTDLRRDYDEVLDWQAKCEAANAQISAEQAAHAYTRANRDSIESRLAAANALLQEASSFVFGDLSARIDAHLSEPRT